VLCNDRLEAMDAARVLKVVLAPKKKKGAGAGMRRGGKSIRELMLEKKRMEAAETETETTTEQDDKPAVAVAAKAVVEAGDEDEAVATSQGAGNAGPSCADQ
jgi:hypothetical protein